MVTQFLLLNLQMIAVIIPSMILEIFTIYLVTKTSAKGFPVEFSAFVDFGIWILVLPMPKNYAIYVAAKTAEKAKRLNCLIEKCSSFYRDEAMIRDVWHHKFHQYRLKVLKFKFFQQMRALSLKIHIRPIILNCGLFNIDLTLVLSIFGTLTTYMILICQVEHNVGVCWFRQQSGKRWTSRFSDQLYPSSKD